jgi:hypothetical protein
MVSRHGLKPLSRSDTTLLVRFYPPLISLSFFAPVANSFLVLFSKGLIPRRLAYSFLFHALGNVKSLRLPSHCAFFTKVFLVRR